MEIPLFLRWLLFFLISFYFSSITDNTFIPSETLSPWWWGIHSLLSTLQRFAVCWAWLTTCYLACANVTNSKHTCTHRELCSCICHGFTWLLKHKVAAILIKWCLLRYAVCWIHVLVPFSLSCIASTFFFFLICLFLWYWLICHNYLPLENDSQQTLSALYVNFTAFTSHYSQFMN